MRSRCRSAFSCVMPLSLRTWFLHRPKTRTLSATSRPAACEALALHVMSLLSFLPAMESLVTRWPRESDARMA